MSEFVSDHKARFASQIGDNEHLAQLECCQGNSSSERGEVIYPVLATLLINPCLRRRLMMREIC